MKRGKNMEEENFEKLSLLLKEAAPDYLRYEAKQRLKKKIICCFAVFCIFFASYTGFYLYDYKLYTSAQDSYISSIGLPVDEYGFLQF